MKSIFRTGYIIRQILTPLLLLTVTVLFLFLGNSKNQDVYYVFSVVTGLGALINLIRFLGWNYFIIELGEEKLKVRYALAGRVSTYKYTSLKRIHANRRTLQGEGMVLRTEGGIGVFSKFRNLDLYFKNGEQISFSEDHYKNFSELSDFIIKKKSAI